MIKSMRPLISRAYIFSEEQIAWEPYMIINLIEMLHNKFMNILGE